MGQFGKKKFSGLMRLKIELRMDTLYKTEICSNLHYNHISATPNTAHLLPTAMENQRADCVLCRRECRPRQHCLQCDYCERWQHRTCQTGITQDFYRQLVKGEVTLENWPCYVCSLTVNLPTQAHTPISELTTEPTREDAIDTECLDSLSRNTVRLGAEPQQTPQIETRAESQDTYHTSAEPASLEDEISFLYLADSPLPLPSKVTPRASGMPRLVPTSPSSSSEELLLYLPETPSVSMLYPRGLTSPTPSDSPDDESLPWFSFLQSPAPLNFVSTPARHTPAPSCQTSTLTSPLLLSHLQTLQTPRGLSVRGVESQTEWSATTDSPFPSPTSFLLSPSNHFSVLLSPSNNISSISSALPLFDKSDKDTEDRSSDSDLHSPLAQLEHRLSRELVL